MRLSALMNRSKAFGFTRHRQRAVAWPLLTLALCASLATSTVARAQAPPKKATNEDKSLYAKDGAEIGGKPDDPAGVRRTEVHVDGFTGEVGSAAHLARANGA